MLDLVDVITLRWSPTKINFIRQNDPEEFLYQESLMGTFFNICLLLLENNEIVQNDQEPGKVMKI